MRISQMTSTKSWLAQSLKENRYNNTHHTNNKEISSHSSQIEYYQNTDYKIYKIISKIIKRIKEN